MKTAILLLLVTLTLAQQSLNYLPHVDSSASNDALIEQFAELQPEIFKKVFQHYIVEAIT